MEFRIVLDATPTLANALLAIANALSPKSAAASIPAFQPPVDERPLSSTEASNLQPVATAKKAGPKAVAKTQAPAEVVKVTLEQVREKANEKISSNRDGVVKLLGKYGAKNVASIDPKDYAAFLNGLNSL